MTHTPHELAADFPEYIDNIHELKLNDTHFQRIAKRYHEINRSVHRAETNVEPTSDEQLINMRKQRMVLKDEIYGILKAAKGN